MINGQGGAGDTQLVFLPNRTTDGEDISYIAYNNFAQIVCRSVSLPRATLLTLSMSLYPS